MQPHAAAVHEGHLQSPAAGARLADALGRRLSPDADRAARLGWRMASLWQGTLVWWAFRRDAAPAVKVREALEDWVREIARPASRR